MKKMLLLGVAFSALALAAPAHAELKFKPGEDSKFHWDNYEALKKVDLKGETLTIGALTIEIVAATDRAIEAVRITRRKK